MDIVLGAGVRLFGANVVDTALCVALSLSALYAALSVMGVRAAVQPFVDFAHASPLSAVLILVGAPAAMIAAYHAVTVVLLGATAGQRLFGLRVANASTGGKPGPLRSVLRGVLVSLGSVFLLAGPLFGVLIDRRRRGLGDLLTGCVVARRQGENA